MEDNDFNINRALGYAFSETISAGTASVKNTVLDIVYKSFDFINDQQKLIFNLGFSSYQKTIKNSITKTKTFFSTNKPQLIKNFYVPANVISPFENRLIKSCKLEDICNLSKLSIIEATGGSGKTILMKYFTSNCIEDKFRLPIFIELRNLTNVNKDFNDILIDHLLKYKINHDRELLKQFIDKGSFIILLDGLDEMEESLSKDFILSLNNFLKKNDKTFILISSRPNLELEALAGFSRFKVAPFSLEMSINIVNKVDLSEQTKNKFIADLKKSLYKEHETFLSNPLLLSIMLLTYNRTGSIPQKITTFYSEAYSALYSRHDAAKDCFLRKKKSNLDISDFEKVFSFFCFITYLKEQHSFTKTEILDYIKNTIKHSNIDFKAENFLHDLKSSVCLLVEDGGIYSFSHRTFQEYFAIKFIATISNIEKKCKIVEKQLEKLISDESFPLLFEIDKAFAENHVILPYIEKIKKLFKIKNSLNKKTYLKILSYYAHKISFREHIAFYTISTSEFFDKYNGKLYLFIFRKYLLRNIPKKLFKLRSIDTGKILKIETKDLGERRYANLSEEIYKANDFFLSSYYIEEFFKLGVELENKYKNEDSSLDDLLDTL